MSSISWGPAQNVPFNAGTQAGEVLQAARTHLNDDEGILWPDQKLFPKLREAHKLMQLALIQNGVPVIHEVTTTPILITAGVVDPTALAAYPTNLIQPIWLKERAAGSLIQDFVDMHETDFLPQVQQSRSLVWWSWRKQKINFLGATSDREIMIRYRGGLKVPQEVTDTIGPFFGELFLSFKTAALAVGSITPRDSDRIQYLEGQAAGNLENMLVNSAMEAQNLPTKRRPYHRGRGKSRVLRGY